jgi:hypothetical protein
VPGQEVALSDKTSAIGMTLFCLQWRNICDGDDRLVHAPDVPFDNAKANQDWRLLG